jgi:predicted phage terminase large subunit-like protein
MEELLEVEGGKSFALLMEPLRHFNNEKFSGVIFRRNSTQIRNEGGLWDESYNMYFKLGAKPRQIYLDWTFKSGMTIRFAHLQHEHTVYDWQGSQVPFFGFDELTHFTEKQFLYMLSRNRSTSGVAGYVRATCNPDVDSWVRQWIDWYLDKDGFVIPERSGVIRWYVRENDLMHWGDSKEELVNKFGNAHIPKSFTFIKSSLQDNKVLMEKDPSYLANLMSQSKVERARLLDGNWNIRASAGNVFDRTWFPIVDSIPARVVRQVRFWDRAATKPNANNPDPDWTRGVRVFRLDNGKYLVADLKSIRDSAGQVEQFIKNVASHDGYECAVGVMQDPASAGVAEMEYFVKAMTGFDIRVGTQTKDKVTRAKPASAQSEFGNILVLRGPWNEEFFKELENFPEGVHDDIVDAFSGAFNELAQDVSMFDLY